MTANGNVTHVFVTSTVRAVPAARCLSQQQQQQTVALNGSGLPSLSPFIGAQAWIVVTRWKTVSGSRMGVFELVFWESQVTQLYSHGT